ncbi:uncharacterized protein LOC133348035 [Lethenteron reissneri]|uniref:uncharacterized protein LOC133348035 n=1 Tax=Lethenteron reissneri TaxID=7753 RepID=UPI002AB78C95|nr:uncharacterized protein LOC133348035 [Lethenteron reissneri]XP_061416842.1 uncharacterized protein LOC133348035 [Lethenteron reissneri]
MEVNLDFLKTLDRFDKTSNAVHGKIEKCCQHLESFIASTFSSSEGRVQEIRKDLQPISTRYKDISTRTSFLVQRAKSRNDHYLQVAYKVVEDKISPEEAGKEFASELHDLVTSLRNIIGEHNEVVLFLRRAVDVSQKITGDERKHANRMQFLQTVLTYTAIMSLVVGVVTLAEIVDVRESVIGAVLAQVRTTLGWETGVERAITRVRVVFSEGAVAAIMAIVAMITSRSLRCTGALAAGGALVTAATREAVKVMPLAGIMVSAGLVGVASVAIKTWVKPKAAWKNNEEHEAWKSKGARFTEELDEIEESIQEANGDLGGVDHFLKLLADEMKTSPSNRTLISKTNFKFMIKQCQDHQR